MIIYEKKNVYQLKSWQINSLFLFCSCYHDFPMIWIFYFFNYSNICKRTLN